MKKHLYESVSLIGILHSACGIPIMSLKPAKTYEKRWRQNFAGIRRKVTCKNCKRTKLFKNKK